MKTLFVLLFFLSSLAFAGENNIPEGIFRVDTTHSRMVLFEKVQDLKGHVELKSDLNDSKIILQTEDAYFESLSLTGEENDLLLKGTLIVRGNERTVLLKGRYLGKIQDPNGEIKTAFRFSNEEVSIRIFAIKPANDTKAIYKIVEQIVEIEQ